MSQNFWWPPGSSSAGSVTANQGTPNNDANAWPVRITDGTHDATVTAGGALNVALSGLANPLPVTDAAAEASLSSIDTKTPTVGQKVMAASSPVVIASDQSAIPVTGSSPINTNGTIVNASLTATTASSASAPSTAVGFILEAPSDNTNNIRWCIGGTASTSVGMLTEPGRDSGFVPCKATISICATVSGTNAYSIQWIQSS